MRVAMGCAGFFLAAVGFASAAQAAETITYTYDELGRLVATTSSGNVNNGVATSIAYDPAGNRSTYSVTGAGGLPGGPTFSISDATPTVEGAAFHYFTITRTGDTSASAGISYATANGTAVAPGDYIAASSPITFAAGQASVTLSFQSINDAAAEPDETFFVNLSQPGGGATIADGQGVATILDNDSPPPSGPIFSVSDSSAVVEGAAFHYFTVTRAGDTSTSASVYFATANGTATAPADYISASNPLSFAAGQTSISLSFQSVNDSADEPDETFFVNLSQPSSGATIADGQGVATIVDNDPPPPSGATFSISDATPTVEGAAFHYFTVTRGGDTSVSASVYFATANGTATAPADYISAANPLTFAAGQTTITLSFQSINDSADEPEETFFVNLSQPSSGSTIIDSQGVAAILDND